MVTVDSSRIIVGSAVQREPNIGSIGPEPEKDLGTSCKETKHRRNSDRQVLVLGSPGGDI